jgi:hypothetical protein
MKLRYFCLALSLAACGQVDEQLAQTAPKEDRSGDLTKLPPPPPPPPATYELTGYPGLPSGGSASYLLSNSSGPAPAATWTILSGGGVLSSSTANPVKYTAPIVASPTNVSLQASSGGKTYKISITVVLPVTGYPEGLTGGVSYINHECSVSWAGILGFLGSGVGCVASIVSPPLAVAACGSAAFGAINAGVSGLTSCNPPTEYVTGSVNGYRTLVLNSSNKTFLTASAPGWLNRQEGDLGNNATFGFYHQELTSPANGGTGLTSGPTDLFKLPYGTDCGFHHNQNSPANLSTGIGTCMGYDANISCPSGWTRKTMYDSNSSGGYFVWCEYDDPHYICANDPSCLQTAHDTGMACGLGSDTADGNPGVCGEIGANLCPTSWTPSGYFDDGRPSGQGLMVCLPI